MFEKEGTFSAIDAAMHAVAYCTIMHIIENIRSALFFNKESDHWLRDCRMLLFAFYQADNHIIPPTPIIQVNRDIAGTLLGLHCG